MLCFGLKTEQQESARLAAPSRTRYLQVGCRALAKPAAQPFLGNGKTCSGVHSAKAQSNAGGLSPGRWHSIGWVLLFASSSLSSKLSPGRAAFVHISSFPQGFQPWTSRVTRALDPSVSNLYSLLGDSAATWPGPRFQRARPGRGLEPTSEGRDGCRLLSETCWKAET